MRKLTVSMIALTTVIALSAAGAASAEKPVVVEAVTYPPLTINGGFTPKVLPQKVFAPVVLGISAKIRTEDVTQPLAMRELVLDIDRNVAIDVRGIPICKGGGRDIRTNHLPAHCRPSVIGEGITRVLVIWPFPETFSSIAESESFVVNGGVQGGTTTLHILTYLTQPITTAIVTTVKVRRIRNGRYGTEAVAKIPVIAGGAGTISSFDLVLNKGLKVEGKPFSILGAKCPDGRLQAHGLAKFDDGTKAEAELTRTCISR